MIEIRIGPTESLPIPRRPPAWHWRSRPVAVAGGPQVDPVLAEEALVAIHRQAAASENEVCGLLLGRIREWQGRYFPEVTAAVPGETAESGPAHVTFTGETWTRMLASVEELHPREVVLGWYHSHPRMEVFLSEMDLSIHRQLFTQPWHLAMVINAQDQRFALFSWQDGEIAAARQLSIVEGPGGGYRLEPTSQDHPFSYRLEPRSEAPLRALALGAGALAAALALGALLLPRGRS